MDQYFQPDSVDIVEDYVYLAMSSLEGSVWNGCIRKVHLVDFEVIQEIPCHFGISLLRQFYANDVTRIAIAQDDGNIGVYDLDLNPLQTFQGHDDIASSLAFNSVNAPIVSAGWDGAIMCWDMTSRNPIVSCSRAHSSAINGLSISSMMPFVLGSAGNDGFMRLWDTRVDMNEGCSQILNLGSFGTAINMSETEEYICSVGTADGVIHIVDFRGKDVILDSTRLHKRRINKIVTNKRRKNVIATCSDDHSIIFSDISVKQQTSSTRVSESSEIVRLNVHDDFITDFKWVPQYQNDQDMIISTSFDKTYKKNYVFLRS